MAAQPQLDVGLHDGGVLALLGGGFGLVATLLFTRNPFSSVLSHRYSQAQFPTGVPQMTTTSSPPATTTTDFPLLYSTNVAPVAHNVCNGDLRCDQVEGLSTSYPSYTVSRSSAAMSTASASIPAVSSFPSSSSPTHSSSNPVPVERQLQIFLTMVWALARFFISQRLEGLDVTSLIAVVLLGIMLVQACLWLWSMLASRRTGAVHSDHPIVHDTTSTPPSPPSSSVTQEQLNDLERQQQAQMEAIKFHHKEQLDTLESCITRQLSSIEDRIQISVDRRMVDETAQIMEQRVGDLEDIIAVLKSAGQRPVGLVSEGRRLDVTARAPKGSVDSLRDELFAELESLRDAVVRHDSREFACTHLSDAEALQRLTSRVDALTLEVSSIKSEVTGVPELHRKIETVGSSLAAVRDELRGVGQRGDRQGSEIEKILIEGIELRESHDSLSVKVGDLEGLLFREEQQSDLHSLFDSRDDGDEGDDKGSDGEDDEDEEGDDGKPPAAPHVVVSIPIIEVTPPAEVTPPSPGPASSSPSKHEAADETSSSPPLVAELQHELLVEVPQLIIASGDGLESLSVVDAPASQVSSDDDDLPLVTPLPKSRPESPRPESPRTECRAESPLPALPESPVLESPLESPRVDSSISDVPLPAALEDVVQSTGDDISIFGSDEAEPEAPETEAAETGDDMEFEKSPESMDMLLGQGTGSSDSGADDDEKSEGMDGIENHIIPDDVLEEMPDVDAEVAEELLRLYFEADDIDMEDGASSDGQEQEQEQQMEDFSEDEEPIDPRSLDYSDNTFDDPEDEDDERAGTVEEVFRSRPDGDDVPLFAAMPVETENAQNIDVSREDGDDVPLFAPHMPAEIERRADEICKGSKGGEGESSNGDQPQKRRRDSEASDTSPEPPVKRQTNEETAPPALLQPSIDDEFFAESQAPVDPQTPANGTSSPPGSETEGPHPGSSNDRTESNGTLEVPETPAPRSLRKKPGTRSSTAPKTPVTPASPSPSPLPRPSGSKTPNLFISLMAVASNQTSRTPSPVMAAASRQTPSTAPPPMAPRQSYSPPGQTTFSSAAARPAQQPPVQQSVQAQAPQAGSGQTQQQQSQPAGGPESHWTCFCGGETFSAPSPVPRSCGKQCSRRHPCKHRCERVCHPGECPTCLMLAPQVCRKWRKK